MRPDTDPAPSSAEEVPTVAPLVPITDARRLRDLYLIERVVRLTDTMFRIPGTRFRFGLDPIIGLFPFFGEVVSFVIGVGLIGAMARHGASGKVIARMVINVLIDLTLGSIPLVGDLFDAYWKANHRNLKLLKAHLIEGQHQGSAWGILLTAGLVLLVVAGLVFYLLWQLLTWALGLLAA